MALTRKGTLAFGMGSVGLATPTGGAAAGISAVQSAEITDEFTVNVQGKDTGGEVTTHVYGDTKHTARVEGLHTAATLPSLGDALTVGSKEVVVNRATVQASNEDFVRISIEGEGYNSIDYGT